MHFSIRAVSTDESLASDWKIIRTSALDSKQHVRLDLQMSTRYNLSGICQLYSKDTKSGVKSFPGLNPVILVFQILLFLYSYLMYLK